MLTAASFLLVEGNERVLSDPPNSGPFERVDSQVEKTSPVTQVSLSLDWRRPSRMLPLSRLSPKKVNSFGENPDRPDGKLPGSRQKRGELKACFDWEGEPPAEPNEGEIAFFRGSAGASPSRKCLLMNFKTRSKIKFKIKNRARRECIPPTGS